MCYVQMGVHSRIFISEVSVQFMIVQEMNTLVTFSTSDYICFTQMCLSQELFMFIFRNWVCGCADLRNNATYD